MQKKSDIHMFQGLQLDFDPQKSPANCLIDAWNIRCTNREESTNMALTPEKGNILLKEEDVNIKGKYLAHDVINNHIILFTHDDKDSSEELGGAFSPDYIYDIVLKEDNNLEINQFYNGNLGFKLGSNFQTLCYYESSDVIKIYWVDGINQPRVANIADKTGNKVDTTFDFTPKVKLGEKIKVTKSYGSGMFPPGSIQYCITYSNNFLQESNIVWTSPIYYTSFEDRGGAANESCPCYFTLNIKGLDSNFDNVNLYSIIRTSEKGQPACKKVGTFPIRNNKASFKFNTRVWKDYFNSIKGVYAIKNDNTLVPITSLKAIRGQNIIWPFYCKPSYYSIASEEYKGIRVIKNTQDKIYKTEYLFEDNEGINNLAVTNTPIIDKDILSYKYGITTIVDKINNLPTTVNSTESEIIDIKPITASLNNIKIRLSQNENLTGLDDIVKIKGEQLLEYNLSVSSSGEFYSIPEDTSIFITKELKVYELNFEGKAYISCSPEDYYGNTEIKNFNGSVIISIKDGVQESISLSEVTDDKLLKEFYTISNLFFIPDIYDANSESKLKDLKDSYEPQIQIIKENGEKLSVYQFYENYNNNIFINDNKLTIFKPSYWFPIKELIENNLTLCIYKQDRESAELINPKYYRINPNLVDKISNISDYGLSICQSLGYEAALKYYKEIIGFENKESTVGLLAVTSIKNTIKEEEDGSLSLDRIPSAIDYTLYVRNNNREYVSIEDATDLQGTDKNKLEGLFNTLYNRLLSVGSLNLESLLDYKYTTEASQTALYTIDGVYVKGGSTDNKNKVFNVTSDGRLTDNDNSTVDGAPYIITDTTDSHGEDPNDYQYEYINYKDSYTESIIKWVKIPKDANLEIRFKISEKWVQDNVFSKAPEQFDSTLQNRIKEAYIAVSLKKDDSYLWLGTKVTRKPRLIIDKKTEAFLNALKDNTENFSFLGLFNKNVKKAYGTDISYLPLYCASEFGDKDLFLHWMDANIIETTEESFKEQSYSEYYNEDIFNSFSYYSGNSNVSNNNMTIVDYYTTGEIVDPSEILFKNNIPLIASTLVSKDDTLFLGNYKYKTKEDFTSATRIDEEVTLHTVKLEKYSPFISNDVKEYDILSRMDMYSVEVTDAVNKHDTKMKKYTKDSLLSNIGLKTNEKYRFGIQFQDSYGHISTPIWIKDYIIPQEFNNLKMIKPVVQASLNLTKYKDKYVKVRGVIVIPPKGERHIIAQGFVCPTLFTYPDRKLNAPSAQCSWSLLPIYWQFDKKLYVDSKEEIQTFQLSYNKSHVLETTEYYGGQRYYNYGASSYAVSKGTHDEENCPYSYFYVDNSICSFYSPDIEMDSDAEYLGLNDLSYNVLGNVTPEKLQSSLLVECESAGHSSKATKLPIRTTRDDINVNANPEYILISSYSYESKDSSRYNERDPLNSLNDATPYISETSRFIDVGFNSTNEQSGAETYPIYLWSRNGSIGGDPDGDDAKAILKHKVLYEYVYASPQYPYGDAEMAPTLNVKAALFNSEQVEIATVGTTTYYGNINTVVNAIEPYRVSLAGAKSNNGVSIKYKSVPHLVLTFDKPLSSFTKDNVTWYDHEDKLINYNPRESSSHPTDVPWYTKGILLGEISRPSYTTFGYLDDEGEPLSSSLEENTWTVAGEFTPISDEKTDILWEWGDTFYGLYKCLRVYPFTSEDQNSYIQPVVVPLESRINAGFNYDKLKRGLTTIATNHSNFNLYNPAYNNLNDFFTYRCIDDKFNKTEFPLNITWTLKKTALDDIDKWTKVSSANELSLNGKSGSLVKMLTTKNHIIAFQEQSLNRVLFNERAQIPVSDGVPIEISNNYKVEGADVLSDTLGLYNFNSCINSLSGIYFIDRNSKELYSIQDSLELANVSMVNAVTTWFKNADVTHLWYDSYYNDLYIRTNESVLNFSEKLGKFVSFFDYQEANTMFSYNNKVLAITSQEDDSSSKCNIWRNFIDGECSIFSNPYKHSITFISNADPALNKIFTNLELSVDWRNSIKDLGDGVGNDINTFFNEIEVSNEYQLGRCDISIPIYKEGVSYSSRPTNAREKFRVWRIDIPRDTTHKRDRISNPWCQIKLTANANINPFILHNAIVNYYI